MINAKVLSKGWRDRGRDFNKYVLNTLHMPLTMLGIVVGNTMIWPRVEGLGRLFQKQ